MKILHITNGLSEGGVETLLYNLCHNTIRYGNDVSILVLNGNEIKMKHLFENIGIKVYSCKSCNPYSLKNILTIRKYLSHYALIHVHLFPPQLYTIIAYLSLPKSKRPIIITTEHSTYNNRRKHNLFKLLDRFFYSKYKKIICISKQTELNLCQWLDSNKLNNNIITITNGIDLNKFADSSNTINNFLTVNSQCNYIVMVGRFAHPKDQLTLIRAFKYCTQNAHLIFIGTGPNMQKCKLEAENLNLTDRVHFIGHSDNVAGILKGCKIGVLSTQWDGFGLVAIEYMASGIPAVCSDVDGLRDIVGNQSLLFQPGNINELANLLNKLLNDNTFYSAMKDYCKNNAEKYSASSMAQKYIEIYQDLYNQQKQCHKI